MTICWPSVLLISAAISREYRSVLLPAACGTMKRIGLSGYCAAAGDTNAVAKIAQRRNLGIIASPLSVAFSAWAYESKLRMPDTRGGRRSLLTPWAPERGPPVLGEPLHFAAALVGTGLSLAVIDQEIVLEVAERAVGAAMIPQGRAARLDGVVEHHLDGVHQLARPFARPALPVGNGRGNPLG